MFSRKEDRRELRTLGWREWVAFPELRVWAIKAKIDSGARTSSLHVEDMVYYKVNGRTRVRFLILPRQRHALPEIQAEATVIGERIVRGPSGGISERPVIQTNLRIRNEVYPVELMLVTHTQMGFRLVLGRTAIRDRFQIDPGRSYLAGFYPAVGIDAPEDVC